MEGLRKRKKGREKGKKKEKEKGREKGEKGGEGEKKRKIYFSILCCMNYYFWIKFCVLNVARYEMFI